MNLNTSFAKNLFKVFLSKKIYTTPLSCNEYTIACKFQRLVLFISDHYSLCLQVSLLLYVQMMSNKMSSF
jgi:hypothetical protein